MPPTSLILPTAAFTPKIQIARDNNTEEDNVIFSFISKFIYNYRIFIKRRKKGK